MELHEDTIRKRLDATRFDNEFYITYISNYPAGNKKEDEDIARKNIEFAEHAKEDIEFLLSKINDLYEEIDYWKEDNDNK